MSGEATRTDRGTTGGGRYEQLDALRGLAALSVLFSHVMISIPEVWDARGPAAVDGWMRWLLYSPVRLLWAGHEAVIFFFILSGFVLSLPFWRKPEFPSYGRYALKRVVRIYPPYLAAVLVAILACRLCYRGPVEGLSDWFHQSWDEEITWRTIWEHVTMLGSFNNSEYDPVLWSLVHEMRISLIFPFLILLMKRGWWTVPLMAVMGSSALWFYHSARYRGWIAGETDWVATLHYIGFFLVGALTAKYLPVLMRWWEGLPRWLVLAGWGVALLLYTHAFWLPYLFSGPLLPVAKILHKSIVKEWVAAAAVVWVLVGAIRCEPVKHFLMRRVPQFLGKISYSLYLVHAIVLKVLLTVTAGLWWYGWSLLLAIPLGILLSWVFWCLVEKPSILWSKRV